jgi:ectoine hydroxylase-related dioxygenase (phytanoyl-CoA dioxygenase family)
MLAQDVSAAVAAFRTNGFVVLRRFFTPAEIDTLRQAVLEQYYLDPAPEIAGKTLGKISFRRSAQLWRRSDVIRRFAFDPRLAGMACQLLGVRGVRMLTDDVFFKEPRTRVSSWHCDRDFVPIDRDSFVSIWIPLQPTTRLTGTLAYGAGSHAVRVLRPPGRLRHERTSHFWFENVLRGRGHDIVAVPADVGDVLIHHSRTFHMAFPNRAATPRVAYGLHLFDASARFAEPINDEQRLHVDECEWTSLNPGDLVDLHTTPLVFEGNA